MDVAVDGPNFAIIGDEPQQRDFGGTGSPNERLDTNVELPEIRHG
jgi:hypothetical protein